MFIWKSKKFYTTLICFKPQKIYSKKIKRLKDLVKKSTLSKNDYAYFNKIKKNTKGTSQLFHLAFFKKFKAKKILMLGVYHGFDLQLMNYCNKNSMMFGVDKFNDKYCKDWPKTKRKLTWQDAGFGDPPGKPNQILRNLNNQKVSNGNLISLIKSDDAKYLNLLIKKKEKFDLIYIDTSHDYKTVIRQINQCKKILNKKGIISGDDYSDHGTWGVKKAVTEGFNHHYVFCDRIWYVQN